MIAWQFQQVTRQCLKTGVWSKVQRDPVNGKVNIACWNCGGLSTTTHRMCEELQFDMWGLTEPHLVTPSSSRSFLTASAAPADDRYSGVAMCLSPRMSKSLIYSSSNGARILYARFRCKPVNISVVVIYIPTKSKKSPNQADVYKQLRELLDNILRRDNIICMGDFNSRLCRN